MPAAVEGDEVTGVGVEFGADEARVGGRWGGVDEVGF